MANNLGISKNLNTIISALNTKADADSISTIQSNITTLNEKVNDIDTEALQTAINDLTTTVNSKAPIANPSFTGTPKAVTATAGNNTTQIATTAFVTTAVANKTSVDSATKATQDASGNVITSTYATKTDVNGCVKTTGNQTVAGVKTFSSYSQAPNIFETTQALSGSSIDCSSASTFTKTISANTTFTITGVPSSKASTICLLLTNGGSYTVTWPSNVKWPSATVPTLSTGIDLITLFTPNGGTTWYGTLSMTELG